MGSAPRCRTFRPWSIGTFTVVCWSLMNLIAVHPRRQRTNSGDTRRRHLLLRSGRSARACDPVSDGRSVIACCKKRWTKRVREKDQQEKAPARQAVTAGHRMCTAIERRAAQRAAGNPGAEIVGRGAFRGTSALRHKRSFPSCKRSAQRWRGCPSAASSRVSIRIVMDRPIALIPCTMSSSLDKSSELVVIPKRWPRPPNEIALER